MPGFHAFNDFCKRKLQCRSFSLDELPAFLAPSLVSHRTYLAQTSPPGHIASAIRKCMQLSRRAYHVDHSVCYMKRLAFKRLLTSCRQDVAPREWTETHRGCWGSLFIQLKLWKSGSLKRIDARLSVVERYTADAKMTPHIIQLRLIRSMVIVPPSTLVMTQRFGWIAYFNKPEA